MQRCRRRWFDTPKYTPLQGQMVLAINGDPVRFSDVFFRLGVVR